jgi:hypothetical protein
MKLLLQITRNFLLELIAKEGMQESLSQPWRISVHILLFLF